VAGFCIDMLKKERKKKKENINMINLSLVFHNQRVSSTCRSTASAVGQDISPMTVPNSMDVASKHLIRNILQPLGFMLNCFLDKNNQHVLSELYQIDNESGVWSV
jgi:hypothetical protein